MKKISVIITLLCLIMLAGCGKKTLMTIEQETGSTLMGNITPCVAEKLQDVDILVMDNLVKNCTAKEKEGRFLDGLGGYTPLYFIYNDQILIERGNDPNTVTGVVCRTTNKDGEREYITSFGLAEPANITGYEITKRMIGKGILDAIEGYTYEDSIYCNASDSECLAMKESGGRSDGQNYFVAGYRTNLMSPEDWHKLYVINDKLYYPGKSKLGTGILQTSKRDFVDIQDNKIIVRRMMNGEVIGDPATMNPEQLKSNFILETCEIDL